jgi:hypothetical protein
MHSSAASLLQRPLISRRDPSILLHFHVLLDIQKQKVQHVQCNVLTSRRGPSIASTAQWVAVRRIAQPAIRDTERRMQGLVGVDAMPDV